MDLSNLSVFGGTMKQMEWLGQRHRVIAHNVANADTPNFHSRDLKPLDFKATLARVDSVKLASVQGNHLTGTGAQRNTERELSTNMLYEVTPDGNGVDLEQQMIKMQQSRADYTMMANLYQKHIGMMKTAITGR